eukprot:9607091-Prorocentrum_lima.AAC.1
MTSSLVGSEMCIRDSSIADMLWHKGHLHMVTSAPSMARCRIRVNPAVFLSPGVDIVCLLLAWVGDW